MRRGCEPRGRGLGWFRLSRGTFWATVSSLSQKMKLMQGCGHVTGGWYIAAPSSGLRGLLLPDRQGPPAPPIPPRYEVSFLPACL